MSVGNVGEIKETVKLKKTYTRVRTEKEAEIEKRIAANIESLGIMKGYSVSKLQEKLGLNNKDFKGFRDGTKAGSTRNEFQKLRVNTLSLRRILIVV